jgi:F420H(2)-dependent quinone reductase
MLWGGNYLMCWQLQHGLAPRAFALVETVGRRTGQPRQTCVGNGLKGDAFWVAIGRAIATRPLTVRIDLEREADSGSSPVTGPRAE